MKKLLCFCLLAIPFCSYCQNVKPSWQSLNERGYPQWFQDAKLGIFVHWGLYSVPAWASKEGYGEWFYRGLMTGDPDRKKIMSLYADTSLPVLDQYAELTKHWHGELWNPAEWARMFREAGARYVMLVTKHHDGYCLWDSHYQPSWNSTVSGPRRNIVAELTEAVRAEGLRMGFYYSLPEWTNPLHVWMQDPDDSIGRYVEEYMIPQFKELVSRYRPDAIFSDGDWQNSASQFHAEKLISWYYNTVGPDAIVNDRWGRGTQHGFRTPEYSAGIAVQDVPWAECRGIGRSFGYNRNEDLDNFLTDKELIQHFCELVANGGGLTLNVGPMADGTIPFIQQERLKALGNWLKVNGEAIYGMYPVMQLGCVESDKPVPFIETKDMAEPLPVTESIDFDWVRNAPLKGMPVDNFSVVWNGYVEVPHDGEYLFRIEGDDEVWVMLGGDTMLYFNHSWAENDAAQKRLALRKGETLGFRVSLLEKEMESGVRFLWSSDGGQTFVPVPARWNGTVRWSRTLRCATGLNGTEYILEFERPGQQVSLKWPRLPENATVRLLGTSSDLKWHCNKDGMLTIDLSGVDRDELNALNHVWVFRISK